MLINPLITTDLKRRLLVITPVLDGYPRTSTKPSEIPPASSIPCSVKFRRFRTRLFENRKIRIGAAPKREELLIGCLCLADVACRHKRPRKSQICQFAQRTR